MHEKQIDVFGYLLVEEASLLNHHIKIEETLGDTPDNEVNKWHRDIIVPSVKQLVDLIELIVAANISDIIQRNQICQLAENNIINGQIDPKKIKLTDTSEMRSLISLLASKLHSN